MDIAATQAPLAAAPSLIVVASLVGRRWGSQAAGLVGAAPVTVLVGILLVSSDLGADAARTLALATSAHVLAQVVFAIVFGLSAARFGPSRGLAIAAAAYAVLSWSSMYVAPFVVVPLGLVAAIGARRLLGSQEPESAEVGAARLSGGTVLALRAAIALVASVGLYCAAHFFGPAIGGAVGAFPILSATLAYLVGSAHGDTAMRNVLRGLVRALPAYLAFGTTYWLTAPAFGIGGGIVTAICACALTFTAVTRTANPAAAGQAPGQVSVVVGRTITRGSNGSPGG